MLHSQQGNRYKVDKIEKTEHEPHAQRDNTLLASTNRGRLKHGNPSGDFLSAPRCGATTRQKTACQQPAMANGRCRLHGGKSTGPKTVEGLEKSRKARLKHGHYSQAEKLRRRYTKQFLQSVDDALKVYTRVRKNLFD
jgi:hypothetical protein